MTTPITASTDSLVLTERRGPVLVVTLNRAEKRNALNDALVFALGRIVAGLGDDVKAIVIAANGDNFSAGLDLAELRERNVAEGIAHSTGWTPVFEAIQFGRVPVVSVLKGAVIGGGLELALTTHVRVAERTAYYALPEGSRGIFVGGGASVRLPRVIGVGRMMDMMLTGRTYDAAEGLALGLSQYLVEPGEGFAKGIALAERIAQNAGMTNYGVIQMLPRIAEMDRHSGFMVELVFAGIAQAEPEAKARLKAFLEGRAAKVKKDR